MYWTALLILSPTTNERGGRGSWPERRIASLITLVRPVSLRLIVTGAFWVFGDVSDPRAGRATVLSTTRTLAHPEPKALAVDPFRENLKNICLFFLSFFSFFLFFFSV